MKLNKLGPQKATAQRFSTMSVIGPKEQNKGKSFIVANDLDVP
jgi:hypothetical protein